MSNDYSSIPHYLQTEDFYSEVKSRLKLLEAAGSILYLATLDFDHFNYINDLFGYEAGDLTLLRVTKYFSSQLSKDDIFSRIHADLFVFCLNIASYTEAFLISTA